MQKLVSPRLQTIKMVEHTLKNHDDSLITVAELKRSLPKQVNHNTLIRILEYLEESNKIVTSIKGITWTYNPSPKARKAIQEGFEHWKFFNISENFSIESIRNNCHFGDHVKKRLIPTKYKTKSSVKNLFRIELPFFWRMLYTLMDGDEENTVVVLIIAILNHKEYDKLFYYRKK